MNESSSLLWKRRSRTTLTSFCPLLFSRSPSLSRSSVISRCIAFRHQPYHITCYTVPDMERFRNHTQFIPLKDDASRLELLPIESEVGSFNLPSIKNDQDSADKPSRNRTPVIKGWPQTFKTLRKAGSKKAGSLAIGISIALIPLVFTVLSIIAVRLSGSPVPTGGDRIRTATKLGPT